jgi:hypothetical protein
MNILKSGLNNSVLRRGFQTSDILKGEQVSLVNMLNDVSDKYNKIMADKTRTKSEKAVTLSKLKASAAKSISEKYSLLRSSHLNRGEKLLQEIDRVKSAPENETTMFVLAQQLRDLNGKQKSLSELVKADERYMKTFAQFPAEYFGLSKEVYNSINDSALRHHEPALHNAIESYRNDMKRVEELENYITEVDKGLASSIDEKAMETRYDDTEV